MKLKMLFLTLLAVIGLSSCNNDDEPNNISEEIAGNYSGYSIAKCKYFSYNGTPNEQLTIAESNETTVNISFESQSYGTFAINNATVEKVGSAYEIKGNGTCSMGHGNATKDYDCSVVATVSNANDALFSISVPSVMGGMTITFQTGKTPDNISASCSNEGKFAMKVAGMDMGEVETTLKVDATEDGKVTVTLGAFDMEVAAMGSSFKFGDLVMKGMTVNANADGSYAVSGELSDCSVDMNGSKVAVSGNLEGTVTNGIAVCTLTYKPGSMPMNIVGTFTSNPK